VPASVAELDSYFQRVAPGLHACDEARDALRGSFNPPVPAEYAALRLIVRGPPGELDPVPDGVDERVLRSAGEESGEFEQRIDCDVAPGRARAAYLRRTARPCPLLQGPPQRRRVPPRSEPAARRL